MDSNKKAIVNFIESFKSIKNNPSNQQKAVIRRFIESVIVYPTYIEVHTIVDTDNGGE